MPPRLTDQFPIGDAVLITLDKGSHWLAGTVIRHQHPGVWVRTTGKQLWFVTNGNHIRKGAETNSQPQFQSREDS